MRILIFSTAYLPFVGGAEVAIKEITDRLSPSDFAFDLFTLNLDGKQKREEQIGNVCVMRLSCPKWWFPFLAFVRARKLHRAAPYDAVWSIMASYGGLAGLFFKHHFPKVPFVLTLQEGDSLAHIYRRAFFIWPLFTRIFTRADVITAISRYLAEWAQKMCARAPIYIIPNGVNAEAFAEKREKKDFGFGKEAKIIITTSRLVEKNGVSDLIRSLAYLPEEVKLVIVGTGELEKKLRQETKELGLEGQVTFAGFVPHSEVPAYLQSANIFVRPSLSEGLGNSFLEAMAAGLPVVATPVGGIPDFLENGKTGLFCEVRNPQSIAMQVRLLLGNDEFRKILVANASAMVRSRYNWDGIAKAMREVFIQTRV